jgi:hypothetical protein
MCHGEGRHLTAEEYPFGKIVAVACPTCAGCGKVVAASEAEHLKRAARWLACRFNCSVCDADCREAACTPDTLMARALAETAEPPTGGGEGE